MGQLGKEKRLREDRLVGIKTGVPSYIPPELELRGFKLVFYDVSDNKIGEIGSDSFRGKIAEVQFELISFGCGAFSFTINDLPGFNITYRTRVDIHPYFDSIPWFTGFIQVIPKPGKKRPYTFSGFGYFEQLDWVTITASYQNQEVSLIIKDIIQNYVAPDTQIIYNESKIEATSYTITSIDFDHTKAKDALQTLADIAQGYEFGVDNSREFYFRAIDTETRYHYWVGKQFQDIEIEEDPNSVRNKLYVKAGQISGGSNIIGSVQDNTSISTYGLREDVITAPEILNSSDALQWANYILQDLKDPKVKAQIHNVFLDSTKEKIEPKGKCRITVYDGTEYELAVKRVLYSISKSGILAELELGEIQEPFEKQIVDIVKEIDEEKRLSDKRTDQLYNLASNPGSHQHIRADITDFWNSPFWTNISDKPSTFPPESHSHVRADISDLWDTPFWGNIPDKPSTFPPSSHTHPGSDITSQVSDSDKVDGKHASEFASASHNHDSRYYTETELNTSGAGGAVHWNNVTNKPSSYPPSSHTHPGSQITSQVSDSDKLDGKHASEFASASHTHDYSKLVICNPPVDLSLTWDGNWHTYDLSGSYPNAKWAIISVFFQRSNDYTGDFCIRYYGGTYTHTRITSTKVYPSNYRAGGMVWIPLVNGKFDYSAPTNTNADRFVKLLGYAE
ncbi:MAG: hypothetical protein J7L26_04195 [Candidatus Aminicenantes bacterium]|nr:hypothetical protein [Candidatus Aminicenantes bacterium]